MFGNKFNTFINKYGFKINLDENTKRVYIIIKNLQTDEIIPDEIYYSYEDIEEATKKLNNLFVVYAERRFIDNSEEFHYTNAKIFTDFNLNKFYDSIKEGLIQYDVRIGAYKSGTNFGKPHDHGSGFRIHKNNLKVLYSDLIEI